MRLIDLSHTITTGMPQWRGDDQPLRIVRRSDHGPDGHMSSALEIGCHVGTHIDAALHFRSGEPSLESLPVEMFAGRARVVRVPRTDTVGPLAASLLDGIDLDVLDYVLFDTGWDRYWGQERYYREWPYYDEDLAQRLAAAGLRGSGLDTPSLDARDGQAAHDTCAAAGMVNIENLRGLDRLPDAPFTFLALPLKLDGAEASPVRAVALLADDPTGART